MCCGGLALRGYGIFDFALRTHASPIFPSHTVPAPARVDSRPPALSRGQTERDLPIRPIEITRGKVPVVKALRNKFSAFLKTWGLSASPPLPGNQAPAVDVVLALSATDKLLVGTLECEDDEFIFSYSGAFKQRHEVPPIGAFPDRNRVYRSHELWAFFQVRIPPFDRPDVKRVLEMRHLDRENVMAVLPELGGRAVTSPYDLERHRSPA